MVAMALRERLPRVAEVFAAGQISYRLVNSIAYRTALITDPDALAKVDAELAAAIVGWGSLSVAKTEQAIDYWVDRYDPNALRRTEVSARGRHVDVVADQEGTGLSWIDGMLFSHDAAALDQRLDAMARAVCDADPRTVEQRRADALGALAHGGDRLACGCGDPECAAVENGAPGATVVHVIAEERSLADDTPVQLDGEEPPRPGPDKPLREMTIAEALAADPSTGPGQHQSRGGDRRRDHARTAAGRQGRDHRDDPAAGSSRGCAAGAALCAVTQVGRLRPLSRSDLPVPRL
jgi:hypothetical protein